MEKIIDREKETSLKLVTQVMLRVINNESDNNFIQVANNYGTSSRELKEEIGDYTLKIHR